ncbi:hypothetical protein WOLCODRAFT_137098 [Wolfiporia cocos MD-104 SS10]|uniref:CUE domain-containing protein n=1 Tax=Wolfiporia cocos (strain MD-104) TaxID=742152 RepID=A0A2H3JQ55_WOLCO|nr:hypothetical protein WOLCODRAFT_137098 [Wolfiporia cocos MD-104 SS10]
MSFENARITEGLIVALALTSVTSGIFDVKHYIHLQLVPHISRYHQYWRLFTHHFACANSSDMLLTTLLLYNTGVHIERSFGSAKYASFIIVTMLVSTITTFLSLLLLHTSPTVGNLFNYIPCGPFAIVYSILYQHVRLVPQAYQWRLFGLTVNDKATTYLLAAQLAISHFPSTMLPISMGILSGYIYRSDLLQLKSWRVPHRLQRFVESWLAPLYGERRAVRRTIRVFPESRSRRRSDRTATSEEEPVTTADRQGATRQRTAERDTSRRQREIDIRNLSAMFPDVGRDVIADVLQRSPSTEAAAAILLSSRS